LKDLSAQAQRYARAYKQQPKPSKPYSNTKRTAPPKRPTRTPSKPANAVEYDAEELHMDLEEKFNAELEVGTAE
jgi:hypothetical protein